MLKILNTETNFKGMKIEGATKEGYQGSGDKSSRKVGNWVWSKYMSGMYQATMRTVVFYFIYT